MASKKVSKKVAKKVVKKTASKPAEVVQPLSFNRANAKAFAENIYSDRYGRVSFLKLCNGDLSNGKDGGRTLHCALGEAYFTFVDTSVAKFVNGLIKKFGEDMDDNHAAFEEEADGGDKPTVDRFTSKYSDDTPGDTTSHIPTLAVVDALVDVAQLRNQKLETKKKLAAALLHTMSVNDDTCSTDVSDDLERSKSVAEVWREEVLPLLK